MFRSETAGSQRSGRVIPVVGWPPSHLYNVIAAVQSSRCSNAYSQSGLSELETDRISRSWSQSGLPELEPGRVGCKGCQVAWGCDIATKARFRAFVGVERVDWLDPSPLLASPRLGFVRALDQSPL